MSTGDACTKRGYTSRAAARAAHQHAGHRIRAYVCARCGQWHVTNQDKHARDYSARRRTPKHHG